MRVYCKVAGSARYRGQQFDMIVSNCPTLDAQTRTLAKAMYALNRAGVGMGRNGMADLTHISITPARCQRPAASCRWEHEAGAGRSGKSGFQAAWLLDVVVPRRDYGGNERVTCGRFTP